MTTFSLPDSLSNAFWIAALVVGVIFTLLLRLTVRLTANKADNGWDNAIGYTVVTVLLAFLAGWMLSSRSALLIMLIIPTLILGQTLALRMIYEVKYLRACLIAVVHSVLSSAVTGALGIAAGFVLAVVLKRRIVANPIYFIKLLLRLIGIELPISD